MSREHRIRVGPRRVVQRLVATEKQRESRHYRWCLCKRYEIPRLCNASEVPEWMRREYIHRGYRSKYSICLCLRSLFSLHNETGNIWTHLIGGMYFIYHISLFVPDILGTQASDYPYTEGYQDSVDRFWLLTYLICAATCMLCSACFHLFLCHSHSTKTCLLSFDIHGILLLITSSFLPGFYYGFACHPSLQRRYICIIMVLITIALVFCNISWIRKHERFGFYYAVLMALIVASAVVPIVHWCLIRPADEIKEMLPGVLEMLFLYACGFFFFMTYYPERAFPGAFDYVLSSHQIWHVAVFGAALLWWREILRIVNYRHVNTC